MTLLLMIIIFLMVVMINGQADEREERAKYYDKTLPDNEHKDKVLPVDNMEINTFFINEERLLGILNNNGPLNRPIGYARCNKDVDLYCPIWLATDRERDKVFRNKGGDLQFIIKTRSAHKRPPMITE